MDEQYPFVDWAQVRVAYRTKLEAENSDFAVSMAGSGTDLPCPLHTLSCLLPGSAFVSSGALFEGPPQNAELTLTTLRKTSARTDTVRRIAIPAFDLSIRTNGIVSLEFAYDRSLERQTNVLTLNDENATFVLVDLLRRIEFAAAQSRPEQVPTLYTEGVSTSYDGKGAHTKHTPHLFANGADTRTNEDGTEEEVGALIPHAVSISGFDFDQSVVVALTLAERECAKRDSFQSLGTFGNPDRDAHIHDMLRLWSPTDQWDQQPIGTLRPAIAKDRVAGNVRAGYALNDPNAMALRRKETVDAEKEEERRRRFEQRRDARARGEAVQEEPKAPRRKQQEVITPAPAAEQLTVQIDNGEVKGDDGVGGYTYRQTIHHFYGNYPEEVVVGKVEEDCLLETVITFTSRKPTPPDTLGEIRRFVASTPDLPVEDSKKSDNTNPVYVALNHLTALLEYTSLSPSPPTTTEPVSERDFLRHDSRELRRLAHLLGMRTPSAYETKRTFHSVDKGGEFAKEAREVAALCGVVREQLVAIASPAATHPLPKLLLLVGRWATNVKWVAPGATSTVGASAALAPLSTTLEIRAAARTWKTRDVAAYTGVNHDVFFEAAKRALVRCFLKPDNDKLRTRHLAMQSAMLQRFKIASDKKKDKMDYTPAEQAERDQEEDIRRDNQQADDEDRDADAEGGQVYELMDMAARQKSEVEIA